MILAESDDILVLRGKRGEIDAFEAITMRYQDRIYGLVSTVVTSQALAISIAEASLVQALSNITRLRRGDRLDLWLYRHALEVLHSHPIMAESATAPEDVLRMRLHGLSSRARAVIILHDVLGLSDPEVSEVLSLGVSAVRSLLREARSTMLEETDAAQSCAA